MVAGEFLGPTVEDRPRRFLIEQTFDSDGVQSSSGIGADGKEYPDPVPLAPPVNLRRPDPLDELVRRYVRHELSQRMEAEQWESFEEADDFEIEDDPLDRLTDYEKVFEPPPAKEVTPAAAAASPKEPSPAASDPKVTPEGEAQKST